MNPRLLCKVLGGVTICVVLVAHLFMHVLQFCVCVCVCIYIYIYIYVCVHYELIYQLDAIEYLFVYYQLDCFGLAVQHATSTHTPQDRHLTTPRTPYAVYVNKL